LNFSQTKKKRISNLRETIERFCTINKYHSKGEKKEEQSAEIRLLVEAEKTLFIDRRHTTRTWDYHLVTLLLFLKQHRVMEKIEYAFKNNISCCDDIIR
jgi:hypothetical protein